MTSEDIEFLIRREQDCAHIISIIKLIISEIRDKNLSPTVVCDRETEAEIRVAAFDIFRKAAELQEILTAERLKKENEEMKEE